MATSVLEPISAEQIAVLFGAGVTAAAGGPTAAEFIEAVAGVLVARREWREWVTANAQPHGPVRFEAAMDELSDVADPTLGVLSALNALDPGPLHRTLAAAAGAGARLVTTNFDDLTERALLADGIEAWTVDLQDESQRQRPVDRGAVLKLHGTLRAFAGEADPVAASAPIHATISEIVSRGGGAGLAPRVEAALCDQIDGRVLVVAGYSGSDDLDVMPSLARTAPRAVFWIDHASHELERAQVDSASGPVRELLEAWAAQGVEVALVRGRTGEAFAELGWPSRPHARARARDWRSLLSAWAERAKQHDPSGLAWVGGLAGQLSRFDIERQALRESRPSTRPDGLWGEQRRLYALAQVDYHLNEERPVIRHLLHQARAIAERAGDARTVAQTYHLEARTYRVDREPNRAAAARCLDGALAAIGEQDATGLRADLTLERARLHLSDGDYEPAAQLASDAADAFRSIGELRLVSEAKQVQGHAHSLNWDNAHAGTCLDEAVRIAQLGPYPEREFGARLVRGYHRDATGDVAGAIEDAQAAIEIAINTRHSELSEAYALLALELLERGEFHGVVNACERGLRETRIGTEDERRPLACCLADALVHLGAAGQALQILSQEWELIEQDPKYRLHAAVIRWGAGVADAQEVSDAAAAFVESGRNPDGQITWSMLRLGAPGADVQRLLDRAREMIAYAQQRDRLSHFDRLRRAAWPRSAPTN